MQFIIASVNIYGEQTHYLTENYDHKSDSLNLTFTEEKNLAKKFSSKHDALVEKRRLQDIFDRNLVVDYIDSNDLLNNRDDHIALDKILSKYDAEDIGQAIVCNTTPEQRAKILHEIYLLDTNQHTIV